MYVYTRIRIRILRYYYCG